MSLNCKCFYSPYGLVYKKELHRYIKRKVRGTQQVVSCKRCLGEYKEEIKRKENAEIFFAIACLRWFWDILCCSYFAPLWNTSLNPNLWFFVVIWWVWLFAPTATEGPSFKHQWLIKSMSKTTWPSVSPICWLFSEICDRRNSIPQILQSSTSQKVILYYPNTSTSHIPFNLYKNIKWEYF